jgi:hypothetical protein
MKRTTLTRMLRIAVTLVIAGVSTSARAAEFTEFYTGVRQLGMGGAYTAVVNDETALLTNPAGLGKLRESTFTVIDPELSGSFNDTKIATLSNASNVINLQGLLDALNQNKGVHWNAKAQVFPSVVTSNFGFGVHAKYEYNAEVDPAGNIFRLDYTNDYAAALGYTFKFFGGVLKVGTAARLIDRSEIHKDIPANSTNLTVDSLASEGLGLGADVGMILTIPVQYLPTLAVVARDVGGTSYELGNGLLHQTSTRPGDTQQTLDAGFALFPILANNVRMTLTGDMHDVLKTNLDPDMMKRIHAGLEFNFNDFFFLRGGMNQKYWTAGVELASENFQLQAASYGEDVGATGTPVEDRRWVTKFTFRF